MPKYPPADPGVIIAVTDEEAETRTVPALDEDHFWTTCQPGKPPATCRFLIMGQDGIGCAKGTSLGLDIQRIADAGQMRALGDNCEGRIGNIAPEVWANRMLGRTH